MNPVIIYIIESLIASSLLGGFYFLFFKNLTFFRFNRFYLLLAIVLPFVLPLISLPVSTGRALPNMHVLLDEVNIGATAASEMQISSPVPSLSLMQYIYIGIAGFLLVRIIIGIVSIILVFRKAEKNTMADSQLYVSPQNVNPFSIFKRIVVSEDTYSKQDTLQSILLHEQTHIKQHHGIDSIVAEILCAVFWFNPMLWILKKELKSTHEYLADEEVLEHDFDLAEYFMLMLDNVVGSDVGLANNFNQSLNLKRMKMMKRKRTSSFMKVVSVLVFPFIIGTTIMLTTQCKSKETTESDVYSVWNEKTNQWEEVTNPDKIADALMEKTTTVISDGEKRDEQTTKEAATEDIVFMVVEQMPSFPGGVDALMKFLRENVKYPAKALENGVQGRAYVEFVVTKDGSITDVKTLKGVSESIDKEAIRVVKNMPKWEAGKQRGEFVNVSYRLPINFTLR